MKFAMSSSGHLTNWNKLTTKETKALTYGKLFKKIIKDLLLKYGKLNWLLLRTLNQSLTVLKK